MNFPSHICITAFILFIGFTGTNCPGVDNHPPDPSKYNDTRPRLVVSLTGFNPGSRVYLRHWEGNIAFTYPAGYALYTDAAGKLLTEVVLSLDTSSADLLLYVDQVADGVLDASDFGTYRSAIAVNTTDIYTPVEIAYLTGTLTSMPPVAILTPLAGQQYICIYMPATPPAKPPWDSTMVSSMPEYPDMHGATLTLYDWFPVSIVTPSTTRQFPKITFPSPVTYNETCVLDANSNGKYDAGETVGAATPVP